MMDTEEIEALVKRCRELSKDSEKAVNIWVRETVRRVIYVNPAKLVKAWEKRDDTIPEYDDEDLYLEMMEDTEDFTTAGAREVEYDVSDREVDIALVDPGADLLCSLGEYPPHEDS